MSDDPADLNNLHDIVVLPDVSWWPLAPGWIVLGVLASVTICYYAYRSYRTWRLNAYRRDAIDQLSSVNSSAQIAEILRRTALSITSREEVASLQGEAWLKWLNDHSNTEASESVRTSLLQSIYKPTDSENDTSTLKDFAKHWILNHRRPC